jgi:phenylpropionate dioxygenase-like ring-hydroxylating dioxygenase large terminal subunit
MNRNAWYAACPASRLGLRPLAIRIFDYDLVLFRDAVKAPQALLNRCCHRGVQLSLGKVDNGAISCRYHGWRYSSNGKCVHIPTLLRAAHIPSGAQVRSFPCAERDGYLWVWAGKPTADVQPPPDIAEFGRSRCDRRSKSS